MSGLFAKLRAKIDLHHSSHPVAVQRDQFLAVTADTPLERKAHFTTEAVGAAAAMKGFMAFENHQDAKGIHKPTHARAKEIIAGLASGYVVSLVEEKDLPFPSASDKKKFIADAQRAAVRNAKRALRDSSMYAPAELEAVDEDEKMALRSV